MTNVPYDQFTWQNCWADISTYAHKRTLQRFMRDVVEPALTAIDARIKEYIDQGGAWEAFAVPDMKTVRRETTVAFSLAVQSIWERQLRAYLHQCAIELKPHKTDLLEKAQSNQWADVEKLFLELRGVALSAFPPYQVLSTLHLLGNAARHGEGPSLKKLKQKRPDFWPDMPPDDYQSLVHIGQIVVTIEHLRLFSEAIGAFWDDVEIIRLRSLNSDDERIVQEIEELIAQRQLFE